MDAQVSGARPILPLQLGEIWIAIDAGIVLELLGAKTWMRVPGASPQLPGILSWRSRAIAVLDLRETLALGGTPTNPPPRTVVAQVDDCTFAFFVDVAREARVVDPEQLRAPHVVTGRFVTHELALDGRVMPIVDVAAMIAAVSRGPVESA